MTAATKTKADPVFWLSWWDNPDGPKGKNLPKKDEKRLKTWVSGQRERGEVSELSMCARVEAPTLEEAWKLVDIMYPGAAGDTRFEEECEPGWWPPADRFPRK